VFSYDFLLLSGCCVVDSKSSTALVNISLNSDLDLVVNWFSLWWH